jgi:hypothetical protein
MNEMHSERALALAIKRWKLIVTEPGSGRAGRGFPLSQRAPRTREVKKPPVWLLRETVLAMHDLLITEFGAAAGPR